jgi:hypothetical protein
MAVNKKTPKDALEKVLSLNVPAAEDYPFLMEMELPAGVLNNLTLDDVFWLKLVHRSLHGDMKAMQEVLDRRYGKAQQHIVQEVHNYTYSDFLTEIAASDPSLIEVHDVEPLVIIDEAQVEDDEPEGSGVPTGDEILDDLGF